MPNLTQVQSEIFEKISQAITDQSIPAFQLRPEIMQLKSMLLELSGLDPSPELGIGDGETITKNGLAVSPSNAALCIDDYVRTVTYIRGVYAAIRDLLSPQNDQAIEVLYVGCGPLAPLIIPLLHILKDKPVYFTLIDIHQESVNSVNDILNSLQMTEQVKNVYCQDIMTYNPEHNYTPNLVLSEVMQTALEKEPQVAVSCYLKQLFPLSKIIPESITINLAWAKAEHEFNPNCSNKAKHRIDSGMVLEINEDNLIKWQTEITSQSTESIPANCKTVPQNVSEAYLPLLFTEIQIYQNQKLTEYQSGLTCPIKAKIIGVLEQGKHIQFSYLLGDRPGLIGTVI